MTVETLTCEDGANALSVKRPGRALFALLLLPALAVGPAAAAEVAVLQGLDKITARVSTFDAPLDEAVDFGSLKITARACQKTPPEAPPESAAFLEVVDERPDAEAETVFSGWMFASSPAVSALEHPVYDVWVLDCATAAEEAPEAEKQEDGSAAD